LSRTFSAVATAVALVLLCGCTPKKSSSASGEPLYVAPSDAECQQFAAEIKASYEENDVEAWASLIDFDAIIDRAARGSECSDEFLKGFREGVKESLTKSTPGSMHAEVVAALARGGRYDLLRIRDIDGRKHALFRMLGEPGLNYHEYLLAQGADGTVHAIDLYIYLTGDNVSGLIRQMMVLGSASTGIMSRLSGKNKEFSAGIENYRRMIEAQQAGQFEEGLWIEATLPESLRQQKFAMVARLTIAASVSDDAYTEAVEAYRKQFPGDASVDLISLDSYVSTKKFGKALASLRAIEDEIGGDAYLDVLRACVYLAKEDFDAAEKDARRAMKRESGLADGYWTLVTISLKKRDFDLTVKTLNQIHERFALQFSDFETLPDYAEFVKSPQYELWLASQKAPPTATP